MADVDFVGVVRPRGQGRFSGDAFDVESALAALERIYVRVVGAEHWSNGVLWNCLEVRGQPSNQYPCIRICGGSVRMSRVVLTAKLGRRVDGFALHRCDNPLCVDDEHLYEGTQSQNIRDAVVRGRRVDCGFGRPRIDPVLVKRIVGSVMGRRKLAALLRVGSATIVNYRRSARLAAPRVVSIVPVEADRVGHPPSVGGCWRQLPLF